MNTRSYIVFGKVVPAILIGLGALLTLTNVLTLGRASPFDAGLMLAGLDLVMIGLLVTLTADRWRARAPGRADGRDLWWIGLTSSAATLFTAALVVRVAGGGAIAFLLDLPAMVIGLGLMTMMSFERLHNRLHNRLGAK